MKFNTEGLILASKTLKDNVRLVTVLTKKDGVIRCFAKDKRLLSLSRSNALSPLTYSRLSVFSGRDTYIIDDASEEMMFFEASADIETLAVAQYLCELCIHIVPEGVSSDEALSLLMNSLYILSRGTRPILQVKSVFEMRLMSFTGFMPDILACSACGAYEADTMYFLVSGGNLICKDCFHGEADAVPLSRGALQALRHSLLAEPKRIFSFTASEQSLAQFADCAERYTLARTERSFNSLDYFKKLSQFGK